VVATRIKRDITPKWHVRRSKYTNVDHGKFTDRDFSEWYKITCFTFDFGNDL
jgi:hypothetical protein